MPATALSGNLPNCRRSSARTEWIMSNNIREHILCVAGADGACCVTLKVLLKIVYEKSSCQTKENIVKIGENNKKTRRKK